MSCSIGIGLIAWIVLLTITVHGDPGPNAVIVINGQTILHCTTVDFKASSWLYKLNEMSARIIIATSCKLTAGNNATYYRTEPGNNACRLIISNVTMQQAGIYLCNDGGSNVYRSLVTIIDPVASIVVYNHSGEVVEGDQLNISCSINYNGSASPAPSLRPLPHWTTSPGQIFTSAISHPSTNVVTLMTTVTVQTPTVPIFQCDTVFEVTGSDNTLYNSTAPADKLTVGSTTELDVQYPVRPISIHSTSLSEDKCISKPETLTCTSNANPPAQYMWFDLQNNTNTTGAVLSISSGGQYQCTAFNSIRNQTYKVTKNVTQTTCSEESPSLLQPGSPPSLLWLTFLVYFGVGWIFGGLFAIYYDKSDKKSTYNKHFPFLEKMLPCMNTDANATTFERCGWIILYILMVTIVGVFVIPIMFIKVEFGKTTSGAAYVDKNVHPSGTADPEKDAPPKETIIDEKTNE